MRQLYFHLILILSVLCGASLCTEASAREADIKATISRTHTILDEDIWHGYRRTTFDFEGYKAWIVEPGCGTAAGHPWTWTMQWADAFVDRTGVLELLGQGWHHVTIDIFRTRCDETGLRILADFQNYLTSELGFAPRANLIGMSWGGFFSVRYADTYPRNVEKIYLDAPLLTFDGSFKGDIGPWAGNGWKEDPRMPVNMASDLAGKGIPILLLYGGQDRTVVPSENCEPFAERFRAADGQITVIKRDLFGHHPHGTDPGKTQPITDFFCSPHYTDYVDPMIGTDYTGHTFPGPIYPFGFVSPSPDTDTTTWEHCSGYHYADNSIMGFSQTHVSGTGAADMEDIMIMPLTGRPRFEPGSRENPDKGYRSRFSHSNETARPGYYSVRLDDYDIFCEMTCTKRCSFYRFTYPEKEKAGIIFDMVHGNRDSLIAGNVEMVDSHNVKGFRRSKGFVKDHRYFFWAQFSEEISKPLSRENGAKLHVSLPSGKEVLVRIGISTVSEEAARANLEAELSTWCFDDVARKADAVWNSLLGRFKVECPDQDRAKTFYTALYHSLIMPNLITDADGGYRGWDHEVHQSTDGDKYTNFSLWDTYRALHPFYNIVCPEMNVKFINSWLERYRQIGQLPINEYGANETFCMIGYHSTPVIADAIMQDIKGFDWNLAYEACKQVAEDTLRGVGLYKRYGYIPSGMSGNSVSKVVEYCYDDWCIARIAEKLGYGEEAEYYDKRALYYRNTYDPTTKFLRGRLADGNWIEPFNPLVTSRLGHKDYTEGNAWQYTFYVPQDMTNYISMLGGDSAFEAKLDEMFSTDLDASVNKVADVTGLIGQYAHGNEPSHHAAYLYNFVGKPWKTQEIVSRIKADFYHSGPDGLCGNDDCGQMSSWYVLSSLGFYPVTPAIGYYVIGSPSVNEATIDLPNRRKLHIRTENLSSKNIYIQKLLLDGKEYTRSYIPVDTVTKGADLLFIMGPTPNPTWGSSPEDRPVSRVDAE